jgi:8-oxo-dGTP pyrophosphatase MutT (NUDIX family)
MRRLWEIIGKIMFWLSWPALFIYMFFSKRTRILVVNGNDVLLVKGWLGAGSWGLPGGGLHYAESPAMGAARELKEETGIEVKATDLQLLISGRTKNEQGLQYYRYAYVLILDKRPTISRQKMELIHLQWMDWRRLRDDPRTNRNIRVLIDAWQRSL